MTKIVHDQPPPITRPVRDGDPGSDVWYHALMNVEAADGRDVVVKMMAERRSLGIERYGTPLQTQNGRNVWHDLAQELLDAYAYVTQARLESDGGDIIAERAIDEIDDALLKCLDELALRGPPWRP